jgi:endo-1,4-beta-xylanase
MTLSRRRFLKASSLVAAGAALGGTAVLGVAGRALAATFPSVSVLATRTALYGGPGNVDYRLVGTLGKGQHVTPIGLFGDFARVSAAAIRLANGTLVRHATSGYVLRSALGRLPAGLPTIPVAKVPWIERLIVGPDYPQTIMNRNQPDIYAPPGVRDYRVLGSALVAGTDLRITLSVNWKRQPGAPGDAFGAIRFQNGTWPIVRAPADSRVISIGKAAGAWTFSWQQGEKDALWFGDLMARGDGGLDATLTIPRDGRSVTVAQPGEQARTFRVPGSFYATSRDFGIATQIAPFTDFGITRLSVAQAPTGRSVANLLPSLREAAPAGMTVGLATWEKEIGDPKLLPIIRRQFNRLTVDAGGGLRPDASLYDFNLPDQQVNLAHRNGMKVRFYLPSFSVPSDYAGDPTWYDAAKYPPDRLMALLHDHNDLYMKRYRSYVDEWMVAGETIFQGEFVPWNFWLQAVGLSYVDRVFQWARAADPTGKLLYIFSGDEWKDPEAGAIVRHVADLRSRGIPVDAIGMELHVLATDPPLRSDLFATMKRYADLGVDVVFAEGDVNLYGVAGTQQEKYALQARIYRDIVEALVACGRGTGIATYDLADPNSWLLTPPVVATRGPAEAPLLFDGDGHPKPAFYAVLDALKHPSSVG